MSAAALGARGHRCVLEETRERNTVELVVNGVIVFTYHTKQLQFGVQACSVIMMSLRGVCRDHGFAFPSEGGDGKLDPVCIEAVAAVDQCSLKTTETHRLNQP